MSPEDAERLYDALPRRGRPLHEAPYKGGDWIPKLGALTRRGVVTYLSSGPNATTRALMRGKSDERREHETRTRLKNLDGRQRSGGQESGRARKGTRDLRCAEVVAAYLAMSGGHPGAKPSARAVARWLVATPDCEWITGHTRSIRAIEAALRRAGKAT